MRMKGLEPSLPKKLEPKSSASTNSATSAGVAVIHHSKESRAMETTDRYDRPQFPKTA